MAKKAELVNPLETSSEVVEMEKKVVDNVEQVQDVIVGVDRSIPVILQLNSDKGINLSWVADNFKKLPAETVERLRPDNMRRYLTTETVFDRKTAERATKVRVLSNPLNPILSYAEMREYIRPRQGYHQCWAGAGRDFEAKRLGPYTQVREPTVEQQKVGCKPGEESGEVKKRLDSDGKVEAIAMELPLDLYNEYLEYCSAASGVRGRQIRESFVGSIEDINHELPKQKRLRAIDDSQ